MKDRFVIDSNILIYAVNRSAGDKHRQAKAFLQKAKNREAGIPLQCLAETYFQMIRKDISLKKAEDFIESIKHDSSFEILVYGATDLDSAIGTGEDFWDRLIEETALGNGYSHIYTENVQDFNEINAINPLSQDQEEL